MKWEFGKEKLNYVLNPDGLTESIFVAKGEKNEGQYRGKRFTKAGLKAEKKRMQDELKASLQLNQTSSPEVLITETIPTVGSVSYEEYGKDNDAEIKTDHVRIFGSMKGWFIIFDITDNNVVKFEEYAENFNNKQDVQDKLEQEKILKGKVKFFKNNKGVIFFKGYGEITNES